MIDRQTLLEAVFKLLDGPAPETWKDLSAKINALPPDLRGPLKAATPAQFFSLVTLGDVIDFIDAVES